jgi:hypothetical protein
MCSRSRPRSTARFPGFCTVLGLRVQSRLHGVSGSWKYCTMLPSGLSRAERVTDCRDPKDNKYLELSLAAGAETIVSSDDDLLVLDPWRGVRIMRPAEYLDV